MTEKTLKVKLASEVSGYISDTHARATAHMFPVDSNGGYDASVEVVTRYNSEDLGSVKMNKACGHISLTFEEWETLSATINHLIFQQNKRQKDVY